MRILHSADWHLGKLFYGRSLLEDQQHFIFHTFLPLVDERPTDGVILAGDIYDRAVAPADALRLFDRFVEELCGKRGIPLYIAVGNHDGADRFSLGSSLLARQGLHIAARLPELPRLVLQDSETLIHLYLLPFFDLQTARYLLQDDDISTLGQAVQRLLQPVRAQLAPEAFNILVTHCFVSGAKMHTQEEDAYVGTLQQIDSGVFDGFDYVALGHLHAPQSIGSMRYSGSPLKYSFDECNQRKSVTELTVTGKQARLREIPVTPAHDVRVLTGSLQQLLDAAAYDPSPEDYLFAELTGAPAFEPMARLRAYYPNLLGLRNGVEPADTAQTRARADLRAQLRRQQPDQEKIFTGFLTDICGTPPSEQDLQLFRQVCKEARP